MTRLPRTLRSPGGRSPLCAALCLLAAWAPAAAGQTFVPTSDDRFIRVPGAIPVDTLTPVPFQPFDDALNVLQGFSLLASAGQDSSFETDGVVGLGGAFGVSFPIALVAESVLDVSFDLTEGAAFSLQGSLAADVPSSSATLQLERLSPNPAVLISETGDVALDRLAGMPVGSYRLIATAESTLNQGGGTANFDVDFRLACSSPNPLDSDGDDFVDACDLCPLDFDPGQEDTDGDGIGDACNDAVDADGDDYADTLDNCPADPNPDQLDADFDTRGDVCDDPEVITQILDPEGFIIFNPTRVALASDGTAYVGAQSSSNVFQIPPVGEVVELFSGVPFGVQIIDVAVGPNDFAYTAGGTPARSYRLDPDTGAWTLLIGPQGDGQGALLEYANRVIVAGDGRVFVSGRDSENVFEIATNGSITEVIGPAGDGTFSLGSPKALDVDDAGNLYVLGGTSSTSPRVFRVTPSHQVELVMSNLPTGVQGADLALGQDGSIYVGGNGIAVRRPSGQIDELLPASDPRYAFALDVDARGVVHVVQQFFGGEAFRITPTGQIGALMDASGDGLGNPLSAANDVAVADGPHKRIVIVARQSRNAFLVADAVPVPLLGPLSLGLIAAAMLLTPVVSRRRRRH